MKHAPLLLLIFALYLTGCGTPPEPRYDPEPGTYQTAMAMIADEVGRIDKQLLAEQYSQAVQQARLLVRHSNYLAGFEPPRSEDRYDEYVEYSAQVDDLAHAADRLLFMLEQRRRAHAEVQLLEVARRYNRLSANYGPNYQLGVLGRTPSELRSTQGAGLSDG